MSKKLNEVINNTQSVFDIKQQDCSYKAFGSAMDKNFPVDMEEHDEIDYEYDNFEDEELNFDE